MSDSFTLKRCLLLCIPALLLGLVLRTLLLVAAPEAMLTADTNSYWDCVSRLWNDGKFAIPEKRRWLYPLLLMAAPAFPGNTTQVVALAQHILGLFAIVGVGWIAGQLTRWRMFVIPIATLLFAASPRGLAYEHQIIADSAMTNCFILSAAVALPLQGISQSRLAWTLSLCAIVIALKPHGKPLVLPILIAVAFFVGMPWRWHWGNCVLSLVCVALFASSGSSRQGGWLLLSSTLPLVRETGDPFPQYRAALAPVVLEARALGAAYPWQQYRYKKLLAGSDSYNAIVIGKSFAEAGPEWNSLTRRNDEFRKVTSTFAWEAVLSSPLQWLHFTGLKIALGLAEAETHLLAAFRPAAFWEEQRVRNEARWIERPKAITLIYERDRLGFDALVRSRIRSRPPIIAAAGLVETAFLQRWFTADFAAHRVHLTCVGMLGLLGFVASHRHPAGPVLAGAFGLSLVSSFGIGDALPRYVYPVEWMLVLFPLIGIAAIADAVRFFHLRRAR